MGLHVNQNVAIPVLTRHIATSSGKCKKDGVSLAENCVMADAIRERFDGAEEVSVSSAYATFVWEGNQVELALDFETQSTIRTFDNALSRLQNGYIPTVKALVAEVRKYIPRTVHGTVQAVYPR